MYALQNVGECMIYDKTHRRHNCGKLESQLVFGNQTRCTDTLLLITKPNTTKLAYADGSTLTCTITKQRLGGYFAMQGDKSCSRLIQKKMHMQRQTHT